MYAQINVEKVFAFVPITVVFASVIRTIDVTNTLKGVQAESTLSRCRQIGLLHLYCIQNYKAIYVELKCTAYGPLQS